VVEINCGEVHIFALALANLTHREKLGHAQRADYPERLVRAVYLCVGVLFLRLFAESENHDPCEAQHHRDVLVAKYFLFVDEEAEDARPDRVRLHENHQERYWNQSRCIIAQNEICLA